MARHKTTETAAQESADEILEQHIRMVENPKIANATACQITANKARKYFAAMGVTREDMAMTDAVGAAEKEMTQ